MSSTILFTSIPPSNDEALLSLLGPPRPITVRFERPRTLLREITRVANVCGRQHPIVDIAVPDLSILRGFEKMPPFEEAWLPDVERASYNLKIQPGCPKQIERLCFFFQTHRSIRTLRLSLFEYQSEEMVQKSNMLLPLPPMLERKSKEEEEAEQMGKMLVSGIFTSCGRQQMIGYDVEAVMRMILFQDEEQPQQPKLEPLADEFFAHPLPERLEHLTLKAPITGPGVKRDFLFVLPNLVTLDLSYCSIDDDAFDVIGAVIGQRLPKLETLTMARNKLQNAPLCEMVGHSLAQVDLSYNPITSKAVFDLFEGVENTSVPMQIDLSYSGIVDRIECIGLSGVQLYLPNCVKTLDLTFCRIDDRAFLALSPFLAIRTHAIETLTLSNNRLQNARIGELVRPKLRSLNLSRNPITSRAASSLFLAMEQNSTLASVDLSHTAITFAGLEFHRIQHWLARPAVLRMPACFEHHELWQILAFVQAGVGLQLENMMAEMVGIE